MGGGYRTRLRWLGVFGKARAVHYGDSSIRRRAQSLSWQWVMWPVSFTQKGFPCLSWGSFNKWRGRFSRRFFIILKGKLQAACSEQGLLGPCLLKSWLQHTGQIMREISLSEGNSWPWRRMNYVSFFRNGRAERWEQTRRLIHAEVSTLERWNAKKKSKVPPPPTPSTALKSVPPFPSLFLFSPLSRAVSLSLLSWKSAVSARLKVLRKIRKVSQSNPTLVHSKWYISGT